MKSLSILLLAGTLFAQTKVQDCNQSNVKPGPCVIGGCINTDSNSGYLICEGRVKGPDVIVKPKSKAVYEAPLSQQRKGDCPGVSNNLAMLSTPVGSLLVVKSCTVRLNAGVKEDTPITAVVVPNCEDSVTFHGHSRAIKEIFPEECGPLVTLTACMDNLGRNVKCENEPPDVPAIQVKDGNSLAGPCAPGEKPDVWDYCSRAYDICTDKSRVLLHSEDGTAWCHRIESQ